MLEEIYQESLEIELALRGIPFRSKQELAPEHEAQVLNYLRIARQSVGYLINFAHRDTLQWKRFVLSEIISAD